MAIMAIMSENGIFEILAYSVISSTSLEFGNVGTSGIGLYLVDLDIMTSYSIMREMVKC